MKKLLCLSLSFVFVLTTAQAKLNVTYPDCQDEANAYDAECTLGTCNDPSTCSADTCKQLQQVFTECEEIEKVVKEAIDGSAPSAPGTVPTSTDPGDIEAVVLEELGKPSVSTTNSGAKYAAGYQGPVFDGPGLRGGANQVAGQLDNNVSKERNLKRLIIDWTNFMLSVAAIMAVVALVWAGFLYITAFGDDSRMETAKKIVIWVVLGILLILASYAIVNTVMRAVF